MQETLCLKHIFGIIFMYFGSMTLWIIGPLENRNITNKLKLPAFIDSGRQRAYQKCETRLLIKYIPTAPVFEVNNSQLERYSRACVQYNDVLDSAAGKKATQTATLYIG